MSLRALRAAGSGHIKQRQPTPSPSHKYNTTIHNSKQQQDVKFGAANLRALDFIGGGASSPQQWLDFLGEVKDRRTPPIGSPFQINFNPNRSASDSGDGGGGRAPPPGIAPAKEALPACGDAALTCSCADCPSAPACAPPPAPAPGGRGKGGCRAGAVSCWDLALILGYIVLALAAGGAVAYQKRLRELTEREAELFGALRPLCFWAAAAGGGGALCCQGGAEGGRCWCSRKPLYTLPSLHALPTFPPHTHGALSPPPPPCRPQGPTEPLLQAVSHPAPGGAGGAGGGANGGAEGDDDDTEPLPGDRRYPWLERRLQLLYRAHVSGWGDEGAGGGQ